MLIGEIGHLSDQRVREWFLREQARSEREQQRPKERVKTSPVVTISREFGAGGHTIAAALCERLGKDWQVWDREIIDGIARSAKTRTEMVEALDERTQSWMDHFVKGVFGVPTLEAYAYRHHLAQTVLVIAHQGKAVIVGRGANFVLKDALNVRLAADLEYRVKAIALRESIGHEEAVRRIHHVDRDRADFTRSIFGRDIDDHAAYDLVIQVHMLGIDPTTAAIAAAARSMFGL